MIAAGRRSVVVLAALGDRVFGSLADSFELGNRPGGVLPCAVICSPGLVFVPAPYPYRVESLKLGERFRSRRPWSIRASRKDVLVKVRDGRS